MREGGAVLWLVLGVGDGVGDVYSGLEVGRVRGWG